MDYVWSYLGYKSKVSYTYPEANRVVSELLSKVSTDRNIKPGCGGVHKMNDRRVKGLLRKVRIATAIRNAVEGSKFNLDIERKLIDKSKEGNIDLNCIKHIHIEEGNTQITVVIPPLKFC